MGSSKFMRYKIIIGVALFLCVGTGVTYKLMQSQYKRDDVLRNTLHNTSSVLPPIPTSPPTLTKEIVQAKTVQELYTNSRGQIWTAWQAYWDGNMPLALKLFAAERDQTPKAEYWLNYSDKVLHSLPEYDHALKELQGQLKGDISQTEMAVINMKIYTLAHEFYGKYGMETEASGPLYGPEFNEVEARLTDFDEPVANRLIRDWMHYDSCTDESTVKKAIKDLSDFVSKFPDSPKKPEIDDLLKYYKDGKATCGAGRRRAIAEGGL